MISRMVDVQAREAQGLQKRRIAGLGHRSDYSPICQKTERPLTSIPCETPLTSTCPRSSFMTTSTAACRPATIAELARTDGVRLPASKTPPTWPELLSPGPSSLEVYLRAFAVTVFSDADGRLAATRRC